MAQNNEFLTRIGLKYDTLENWVKAENQFILKAGEVAFATVAAAAEGNAGLAEPVIMMKIGDGFQTFNELKWAFHAKAADVYGWAKKATPDWEDFKNVIPTSFDTNTDTRTSVAINEDEGKLTITTQLYDKGVAQGEADVKVFDVVSAKELETALAGYYTKDEVDGLLEDAADAVTETLKGYYTIEAADAKFETIANVNAYKESNDAALAGVKATAEAAVTDAKLATALEDYYTESEADAKFDAIGAAAAVLGVEGDTADKATVYGAKAAADAAQSTANDVTDRFNAFVAGAAADGGESAQKAIDTLVEIQEYITEDVEAFTALKEKVDSVITYNEEEGRYEAHAMSAEFANQAAVADNATLFDGQSSDYYATAQSVADIVSGTTVVAAADTLDGKHAADFEVAGAAATAEQNAKDYTDDLAEGAVKTNTDNIAKIVAGDTVVAKATHAVSADNATNASTLEGHAANYFEVAGAAAALDAELKPIAKSGDIKDLTQTEGTYIYFNCGSATTIVD